MTDWHARIQRAQHFARALAAAGHRCFYLNPNLGREFPYPVMLGRRLAVHQLEERIWEVHVGLVREPVFHHRLLERSESGEVAAEVAKALDAFGVPRLAILTQFPLWNHAADVIRRRFRASLVYDCHDLLSGFSRMPAEIIAAENELFEQADVVVFSAKSLLEMKLARMPWLTGSAATIPNGADVSHFPFVPENRQKLVGYAGALDEWFDVDAVALAAEANPQASFVLLGRIEDRKVLRLHSLANVKLYGEIPYDRLGVYMSEFDIGLIPFLVTPLTLATNPIKLYEYFSCGMPVVSAPLPEVAAYGDLVYQAATPGEFASQVTAALHEQDPERRRERRRIAEQESWRARAAQLAPLLDRGAQD
jgi:glycosyltransferase involved in cell wall biosynthesis